jgi:hypothetical protein
MGLLWFFNFVQTPGTPRWTPAATTLTSSRGAVVVPMGGAATGQKPGPHHRGRGGHEYTATRRSTAGVTLLVGILLAS